MFQANTLFHHSNLRLPIRLERWLNKLIVTPRMHGIHHSEVRRETNSNYGVVFPWWNRVRRTLGLNIPQSEADRPNVNAPPHSEQTIVIHYQSDTPVIAGPDDTTPFICDLIHPEWGIGKVRGVVSPASQTVIRNVLTFPPSLQ